MSRINVFKEQKIILIPNFWAAVYVQNGCCVKNKHHCTIEASSAIFVVNLLGEAVFSQKLMGWMQKLRQGLWSAAVTAGQRRSSFWWRCIRAAVQRMRRVMGEKERKTVNQSHLSETISWPVSIRRKIYTSVLRAWHKKSHKPDGGSAGSVLSWVHHPAYMALQRRVRAVTGFPLSGGLKEWEGGKKILKYAPA